MTTETKTRKTPVPQGYDRILSGALKLTLENQVQLVKKLKEHIAMTVTQHETAAKAAQEIVNGL